MTRNTYRDFPDNYTHVVEHFADPASPEFALRMNLRSAQALRRDLYRFFSILSDSEEENGKRLAGIAKELSISVRPQTVEPEDEVTFIVYRNPINQVAFDVPQTPVVSQKAPSDLYSLEELEAALEQKRKE